MATKRAFRIGSLYPHTTEGLPNLILSSGYRLKQNGSAFVVYESPRALDGTLRADLSITTEPVQIPGVSTFVKNWLKPQLLNKSDPASIFNQLWSAVVSFAWPTGVYPNNLLLENLSYLGYRGYGWDKFSETTEPWSQASEASGRLYEEVQNLENYFPELVWGSSSESDVVQSDFDTVGLLNNLAAMAAGMNADVPLWLPSMLFTYGKEGSGTSYPGPVLMLKPGEEIKLDFKNRINIPGLSEQQNQQATLVPNSSYGLNGGSTAGGMFSSNFHMHGGHVNPSGFGDNVVSRFTTGQDWTTTIRVPKDHGQGSYWYHPHYHPAVNTQLYGGLSGFMQVGDPLQKVPLFKDVPRNLAVLKTMQVGIDPATGQYQLAAVNGNFLGTQGTAANRASMFTVNGEYMPSIDFADGGWQALTLSNQDNNYYMNISIRHLGSDGQWSELPLFIYGEDGHQYPQIRAASHGSLGYEQLTGQNATGYRQAQNLISLPSGKRVDLLFYLPSGQSELASSYSFESDGTSYEVNNLRYQSGEYADLSAENINPASPTSGPGPIARLNVGGDKRSPSQSDLNRWIKRANKGIDTERITPETVASDYDESAVPSVNLFARNARGTEKWQPIRKREFNYEVLALVGPEDQRDIPTQMALADRSKYPSGATFPYERYTLVPYQPWLGYEGPDFINDHVFPNGPLIITQLGTLEEWSLNNWNWAGPTSGNPQAPNTPNGGNNVGHPFHIHVNDYQVKHSDTELPNKRNLEDVTMLNSSGYHFVDVNGKTQKLDALAGTFQSIPEAQDPSSPQYSSIYTSGHTNTTIRMLFQDFLGTYVHHCHLLEHEDAGMMQVVTVIENTDSSWLLAAENPTVANNSLKLMRADSLSDVSLQIHATDHQTLKRAQAGDLSGDFVQDIMLCFGSNSGTDAGIVEIYDGKSLKETESSLLLSRFVPYKDSSLAPWAFNSDFTGDGARELVTGGFTVNQGSQVHLNDFQIRGWLPSDSNHSWNRRYQYNPWQDTSGVAEESISDSLTGFVVGDFNLDNFDDYAIAYLQADQLRVRIVDGAAVSLYLQTGQNEGGYFPTMPVLSDMTYTSPELSGVDSIVLTSGFNSYAQSPIENLIVSTSSSSGHSSALTFQLDAGHFIATGTADSLNDSSSMHQHGGQSMASAAEVDNQGPLPLHLTASRFWHSHNQPARAPAATPTFAGVLGQGALLVGDSLIISQGTSANGFDYGNPSSSDQLNNTSQDLALSLDGIKRVNRDDITGVVTTDLSSELSASEDQQRLNLAMLAYQAYTNEMIKPSSLADLAAGSDGGDLSVKQLVNSILSSYSTQVISYYGGALENLATADIVSKTYQTLYRRKPSRSELTQWKQRVNAGLSKSDLPMSILQATPNSDRAHLALLSAATRWSQVQWGTSAVIDGAFGQGLQSDRATYEHISQTLLSSPAPSSWQSAQIIFDRYTESVLDILNGTPVADRGFF